jgi:RNA polymerase sigma-70 factor (ECF subfamily)
VLESYHDLAATLGVTEGAVRTAVHRLRRQFARALREQILDTVSSLDEVDDEIRYLLAVLAHPEPGRGGSGSGNL